MEERVEILRKAFRKAYGEDFEEGVYNNEVEEMGGHVDNSYIRACVFEHDFAKKFWGEEVHPVIGDIYALKKAWEFHLQEMVLEEYPLEYIKNFLD